MTIVGEFTYCLMSAADEASNGKSFRQIINYSSQTGIEQELFT